MSGVGGMMEWFYVRDGQSTGPYADDEIARFVRSREIRQDTLVWREGLEEWNAAGNVPETSAMFAKVPPPLPVVKDPDLPGAPSLDEEVEFRRDIETRSTETWSTSQGGAWTRFFARQIDMWIWSLTSIIATMSALPYVSREASDALSNANEFATGILFLAAAAFINAIVITVFGNSIGKAIFGIRARPISPRQHQGFIWNLSREFRVWLYGLAAGIPLIALFTMGLNHTEVKANRPARYDRGIATMDVRPISRIRRALGFVMVVLLYFLVVALAGIAGEMDRETRQSWSWTNPVTGLETTLPGGWSQDRLQETEVGTDFYSFSSEEEFKTVILSTETAPGLDLAAYGDAIEDAVADTVTLDGPWMQTGAGPHPAITTTGLFDEEGYRATYLLWEVDGRFWRLIVVDTLGFMAPDLDALTVAGPLVGTTGS